jgi:beta-mannanase
VTTSAQASQFAQAWRQIVGAIQRVPREHFSFDWSTTDNSGGVNPALAYPGDSYVSSIGMDVYDWSTAASQSASDRWNAIVNDGYGLAWQAGFAASHHKPISFAEWALAYNPSYPTWSGGDDPVFIQNMHNWFSSHNTAFEDYFDVDANGIYYGLNTGSGEFPNSAALYRSLYNGSTYG